MFETVLDIADGGLFVNELRKLKVAEHPVQIAQRLGESDRLAIAYQRTFIEEHLHRLFHEERIAAGPLDDEPLERPYFRRVADHRGQHFFGALLAEWVEPQLCVVGLVAPTV